MPRLIARETKLFGMFVEIAGNLTVGARVLSDLLHNYDYQRLPASVLKITEAEHRGDDLTHRVLIKVNQSFRTAFDREDIRRLVSALDDILDNVYAAGDRLLNYVITQPPPEARILADIILKQVEQLEKAVALRSKDHRLLEHCVEVTRLENEADQVSREAIGRLFNGSHDPLTLLKLKELLEILEEASDKADDAANALEAIVLRKA
jgi:predicted phosphate transport protein (TIGR00153 family)